MSRGGVLSAAVGVMLAFALSPIAGTAQAAPAHAAQAVQTAQPAQAQSCDPLVLDAVAELAWKRSADEMLDYRAQTCKLQPQNPDVMLVALAQSVDDTDAVDLAVALVDAHTKAVLAHYAWQAFEDADFRVDENSLRLDTANYWLNGETLAFGVDVRSGYIPHCEDADVGAARTLFVRQGATLRPVLQDLALSARQFIVASGRCNWGSKTSITAEFTLTLSLAEQSHHGVRDLVVDMRSRRDDGKPAPSKPLRLQVPYDGQFYPTALIKRAFQDWRVWVKPPNSK